MPASRNAAAAPHRAALADRRAIRRDVAASAARVLAVTTVFGLLYVFAPLGQRLQGHVVGALVLSVLLIVLVTAWELRTISRSSHPEVRAVEAVAFVLPLALLPFAATYYAMERTAPGSFATHLSRLDALYFTITTFATVGFGDITPHSESARAIVTVQMAIDLVLIGLLAKVILGAARRRRDTLDLPGQEKADGTR